MNRRNPFPVAHVLVAIFIVGLFALAIASLITDVVVAIREVTP